MTRFRIQRNHQLSLTGTVGVSGSLTITPGGGDPADITTFTVTSSAGGSNLPFSIGHAFAKGDVPSGTPIGADSDVQVTVKRLWNDGSVKHAIICGRKTLTADVAATITLQTNGSVTGGASLTSADIQTAAPSASIQCGAIGTVNLSSLLASPFRTWVSGPEMVECHYRSALGSDPNLNAWFHVRLFAGGRVWIRAFVENGYLGQSPSTNTYTATVVIGGATVHNASVSHYAFTRWCVEGWIGGDPAITPAHNVTYLIGTKLVPNYWKRTPSASKLNGLTQTYAPMQLTPNPVSMGDGGFGDYIGVIPNVAALYVTSGDARAYKAALTASSAFNTYSICRRDQTKQTIPIPTDHPSTTILGGTFNISNSAGTWELNHLVNEGYLAYLVSGDFWHFETLAFNASMCYLCISTSNGTGTSKILRAETRGNGWLLNTVGHHCAIAPVEGAGTNDAAVASNYQSLLASNAAEYATGVASPPAGNTLGTLYQYSFGAWLGTGSIAPWMTDFWVIVNGQVGKMEPMASMADWNTMRDWMYRWPVGRLGASGSDNGHFSRGGSEYGIVIASANSSSTIYTTWGECWTATVGSANAETTNTLNSTPGASNDVARAAVNHRWGVVMSAAAYAFEDSAAGSAAAWARLTGAANWSSVESGATTPANFNDTPVWGIVPRNWNGSSTALGVLASSMIAGDWEQLTVDGLSTSLFFDASTGNNTLGYLDKGCYDAANKQIRFIGHAHNGDQRYHQYDETTNTWSNISDPPWDDGGSGSPSYIGHGYQHNAMDPVTGDHFYRQYNSQTVRRLTRATNTWTTTASASFVDGNDIVNAIEWLPTIGSQGGLVYYGGRNKLATWDKATNTWTTRTNPLGFIDTYHNVALHDRLNNVVYFGGGNGSSAFGQINGAGSASALTNCPISYGIASTISTICPASGSVIIIQSDATKYKYVPGSGWSSLSFSGAPSFGTIGAGSHIVAIPIAPYGVIAFLFGNSSTMWLYKHA